MVYFYTPELVRRLMRKKTAALLWAIGLFVGGICVCAYLCISVCTANAVSHRIAAACVGTLSGWAAIIILALVYFPARAEHKHARRIQDENPSEQTGVLCVGKRAFRIPGSVDALPVELITGEEKESLLVLAILSSLLPTNGTRVKILRSGKFIVGTEECK